MLSDAFNAMLSRHGRSVSIRRGATTATGARITPSNYSRQTSAPSDMVIEGREWVMSRKNLQGLTPAWTPKRGDQLIDTELGTLTITEIIEMFDLGASVMGYRVRTN